MSIKYHLKQFVLLYQCQKSNFYDDFSSKIKSKVSIETWFDCIPGPIQGPEKGLMYKLNNKQQVFSLKYQLKQFVLLYQSQKSNFYDDFSSKIKGKALLETWIYCILGPIQGPEKGLM